MLRCHHFIIQVDFFILLDLLLFRSTCIYLSANTVGLPSIYPSFLPPSIPSALYPSIPPSIHPSLLPSSIFPFCPLSIHPSFCPSILLSIHQSTISSIPSLRRPSHHLAHGIPSGRPRLPSRRPRRRRQQRPQLPASHRCCHRPFRGGRRPALPLHDQKPNTRRFQ